MKTEELQKIIDEYSKDIIPKIMTESGAQKIANDCVWDELIFGYADWDKATKEAIALIETYMEKEGAKEVKA